MREIFASDNISDVISRDKKKLCVVAAVFIIAVVIACTGLLRANKALVCVGVPGAISSGLIFASKRKRISVHKAGCEGQMLLRSYLHSILSNDFIAFFGLSTTGGDIDCTVVGPSGCYVFEAKHHNGQITYDASGWHQWETGKGGPVYDGGMKDPSNQVRGEVLSLKSLLVEKNVKCWINGAVVFTNPAASLSIKSDLRSVTALKLEEIGRLFTGQNLSNAKAAIIERCLVELAGLGTRPTQKQEIGVMECQQGSGVTQMSSNFREKKYA